MRRAWQWGAVPVALALAVGSCGDSSGPGGNLSQAEKTALTQALVNTGGLGGFGAFAAFAIETIGEIGRLTPGTQAALVRAIDDAVSLSVAGIAATEYDAVGFAIDYNYSIQGETFQGWFLGVVGWNGINTSSNTVNEMVVVGGSDYEGTTSLPTSATGTIESGDVFAIYWNGSTDYFGVSGTATVSSANFTGSSTNCGGSSGGFTVVCSYQGGRMNGSFGFTAGAESGDYTQPSVRFASLPAVKLTINVTD
ncbi:MAG: hypothetical protein OER21_07630 [Gemmatimonadota bacterium]|nr:hypothetical protein [Gemmatimonadota bacterium]